MRRLRPLTVAIHCFCLVLAVCDCCWLPVGPDDGGDLDELSHSQVLPTSLVLRQQILERIETAAELDLAPQAAPNAAVQFASIDTLSVPLMPDGIADAGDHAPGGVSLQI
jgi:hypothetical protein